MSLRNVLAGVNVSASMAFVGAGSPEDARALEDDYQAVKTAQSRAARLVLVTCVAAAALISVIAEYVEFGAARYSGVAVTVFEALIALALLRASTPALANALATAGPVVLFVGVLVSSRAVAPDTATAGPDLLALGALPSFAVFMYPPLLPCAVALVALAVAGAFLMAGSPAPIIIVLTMLCVIALALAYVIDRRSREEFLLQRIVRLMEADAAVSRVRDATRDHILGYLFHELRCVRACV